jgi:threonine aldolase
MRQAGIIAAGALYALENQRARLADDNANARRLAEGIAQIDRLAIDLDAVETNIMYFYVQDISAEEFCEQLEARGILMLPIVPNKVRAVTNLNVSTEDIDTVLEQVRALMG